MELSSIVQFIGVGALTVTAMVTDLKWRRIPNWLTVAAFVLGLIFHTVVLGWQGLGFSLGGFAVGFGVLFVLWCIGGGGGGDVKLMGAMGAWLGAKATIFVFLLSAFMAFLCLIVLMMWGLVMPSTVTAGGEATGTQALFKRTIPYAVPAGLSAWLVLAGQMLLLNS